MRILLFPQAVETDPCLGYDLEGTDWGRSSLSVVVLGASGDLAKKKIFPALFALYYEGLLPEVNTAEYKRSFVVVCVCVCVGGGGHLDLDGCVFGDEGGPSEERGERRGLISCWGGVGCQWGPGQEEHLPITLL